MIAGLFFFLDFSERQEISLHRVMPHFAVFRICGTTPPGNCRLRLTA